MVNTDSLKQRMEGALNNFVKELKGLRTGRASASMLDPVMVNAYGSAMPLTQVGSVSVPEPRMITVQVWDNSLTPSVEKAIRESNLGLNPSSDGNLIRIPIPQLNEERRNELVKVAHKYAENAKVAVRKVRRDGMEEVKKAEKEGLSKDEAHSKGNAIQKITDETIAKIDQALETKEKEITTV